MKTRVCMQNFGKIGLYLEVADVKEFRGCPPRELVWRARVFRCSTVTVPMCGVRVLTLCLCGDVLCFDTVFVRVGPAWLLHGLSPRGSASARFSPFSGPCTVGFCTPSPFPVRLLHAPPPFGPCTPLGFCTLRPFRALHTSRLLHAPPPRALHTSRLLHAPPPRALHGD